MNFPAQKLPKWNWSILAVSSAGEVCLSRIMAWHGDFLRGGEGWHFAICGILAGVAYWVASSWFLTASFTKSERVWLFWIVTVVLRLAILPIEPGDDLWRYRWEGMIQLRGFSPYEFAPDAPELTQLRDAGWTRINHRDFPAIYPPLAQAFFAVMAFCGNGVWLYKLTFLLIDVACCGVLRRLLRRSGASDASAVWYAWNPLAVYALSGAAHFDCLMILAFLLALLALDIHAPATGSWPLWTSSLLLGVAAAVKIVPLALVPVWMVAAGTWRRGIGVLILSGVPLIASAMAYGFPAVPVFSALQSFGHNSRVNDPIWWVVDALTGMRFPKGNGLIGAITVCVCLVMTFIFRHDWRRGIFWVWGVVFVLSPVVHAWYVLWILPITVWRGAGGLPWTVLSISMFGYFLLWEVNHESGRPWLEPVWLRLAIYLPAALAFAWSIYRQRVDLPEGGSAIPSNK